MKFVVNLVDEDQIKLETVEAAVVDSNKVDFLIEGTISALGSDTLDAFDGEEVRPVAVTFETTA